MNKAEKYTLKTVELIVRADFWLIRKLLKLIYKAKRWLVRLAIFILVLNSVTGLVVRTVYAPKADAQLVSQEVKKDTQEEIENFVRTIFGKDARVAIAVSHNECSPENPKYPKCQLHTSVENSIGLFQINLASTSKWIHAYKVPGETIDEKIEWLNNPYNNTLVAYKIFKDSGWEAWSAYTSGRYLNDL